MKPNGRPTLCPESLHREIRGLRRAVWTYRPQTSWHKTFKTALLDLLTEAEDEVGCGMLRSASNHIAAVRCLAPLTDPAPWAEEVGYELPANYRLTDEELGLLALAKRAEQLLDDYRPAGTLERHWKDLCYLALDSLESHIETGYEVGVRECLELLDELQVRILVDDIRDVHLGRPEWSLRSAERPAGGWNVN